MFKTSKELAYQHWCTIKTTKLFSKIEILSLTPTSLDRSWKCSICCIHSWLYGFYNCLPLYHLQQEKRTSCIQLTEASTIRLWCTVSHRHPVTFDTSSLLSKAGRPFGIQLTILCNWNFINDMACCNNNSALQVPRWTPVVNCWLRSKWEFEWTS